MANIKLTTNEGISYPSDLQNLTYKEALNEIELLSIATPSDTFEIDRQGDDIICRNYDIDTFEIYEIIY